MTDSSRTINLMKTLQSSGDTVTKFEETIKKFQKDGKKYIDPDFYPNQSYTDADKEILEEHIWKRVEEQYNSDLFYNINPDSIVQGRLGTCYFIAALIYAAHKPELVKALFHPLSSLEVGCVLVYFNFLGEKLPVIVDTQIPYDVTGTTPLFSRPRDNSESPWVSLVEKAFAKACGAFSIIESGQTHFGVHVLLDYFSVSHPSLDCLGDVFGSLLKMKAINAMIGTAVNHIPNGMSEDDFKNYTGLIDKHAYQILDIKEAQKKKFIKLRNPWGNFEWTGDYSDTSDKWTESLKKELGFENSNDGAFWMLFSDFSRYFTSISYSFPPEKNWKKESVYGVITGSIDGRSPCEKSKNVGCIPQWSLKFTKKAKVRIHYEISGNPTYHGLYLAKKAIKVDFLDPESLVIRSSTNSCVNGFEYEITNFDNTYTFFLTRLEENKEVPCFYRIVVESSDTNFVIKKYDDDFSKAVKFETTGSFEPGEFDGWDPYSSPPLTSCRQWFLKFSQKTELRIRVFKNITEKTLDLFIANTDEKISYALKGIEYRDFRLEPFSDFEEYSVQINSVEKPWMICLYRPKSDDITKYKLECICRDKFEYGLMPEPDRENDCGFIISGKLVKGKTDGLSPYGGDISPMKQWNLVFTKPTKLILIYKQKGATTQHSVYLQQKNSIGEKMSTFYKSSLHFDFDIEPDSSYDQCIWDITDVSKPYVLCVTRSAANSPSEYSLELFGKENYKMNEIGGKDTPKTKKVAKKEQKIDFPPLVMVQQPENFSPKSTRPSTQKPTKQSSNNKENEAKKKIEEVKANENEIKSDDKKKAEDKKKTDNKNTTNESNNDSKEEQEKTEAKNQSKCCLLI
ncbi:hypothetical protein TRFO_26383 [Tritrichomonas foetus]|uniref:Calpain catalytic domain-containing protein n=1 Tax=Tritrichomonas foetus TaxID=1144522 RepID=A0A1J4K3M5_9EUKA|nr:hypothetical protein TRFO_26383 [Tritrichomonas foetus]|eukprot:OHT05787.1 hypothetical protein TRFO_26383 [Tritrichomonas foetus]